MADTKKSADADATSLSIRFTRTELAALDAEVARRNAEEPGIGITRSAVIRTFVLRGIASTAGR
jgi:hypothetical protein